MMTRWYRAGSRPQTFSIARVVARIRCSSRWSARADARFGVGSPHHVPRLGDEQRPIAEPEAEYRADALQVERLTREDVDLDVARAAVHGDVALRDELVAGPAARPVV